MRKLASLVIAGMAIALAASPAQAQQGTWELGFDGGFSLTSIDGVDDNLFDISLPFQFIRAGRFVTDQISIEPTLAFQRQSLGDESVTAVTLLATGLYHFGTDRTQRQFYLQGGAGLDYMSFSDEDGVTQWLLGGGAGVKLPVADHVAVRLGALYLHALENEDDFLPSMNSFRGQVGVSLFSR